MIPQTTLPLKEGGSMCELGLSPLGYPSSHAASPIIAPFLSLHTLFLSLHEAIHLLKLVSSF